MVVNVSARAAEAFLFAGPEGDANGALRLDVEGFEDADGFHRHDGACTVVGCAGAGDPAIEVAADHDNLFLEFGIGAGDLGDGVEPVFVVAGKFGFDVDLERDRDVILEETPDAVVVLDHHDGVGNGDGVGLDLRAADDVRSVVVEDDAGAAAVTTVAAGGDYCSYFFFGHHLDRGGAQGGQAHAVRNQLLNVGLAAAAFAGGIGFHLSELFGGVAMEERLGDVWR